VSNDSVPNLRLVGWGVASALVGAILHLGYRTHSAGWMLGAAMLLLAACILLFVLLTARNLRRLNQALCEETLVLGDGAAAYVVEDSSLMALCENEGAD
jgi:hypothetical protein